MKTVLLACCLTLLSCVSEARQQKEVRTVIDHEVGMTVWHDDTNYVTCWIGPREYTMVCMPDAWTRRQPESADLVRSVSSAKRVEEERAAAAASVQ